MLNNFATFDPQTSLLGLPKAISVALQCLNFVAMLLYTEKIGPELSQVREVCCQLKSCIDQLLEMK